MKGSFFLGDRKFEVRNVDIPTIGPDDVLIHVAACGICGTDVHIYHGEKGSADVTPPVILGHEFAGVVEAVGTDVSSLQVGDHVSVDPNIYCGKCHYCKIGKKHLCTNLYAIGVNRNGGFAEYCAVPETQCYRLRENMPLKYGAMSEPLACCLHGIDRAGIKAGDTVCVIGGGAIGLIMVQLAKLSGASCVVLSEPVEMRRQVGLKLGADAVIDPICQDISEQLTKHMGVLGADIVIECVGSPVATEQAFHAAKRGSTILLFGVPKPDADYSLHLVDVFQKELTVAGSMINPDTHGRAVALLNRKAINMEPIITHSYPIEELEAAILMQQCNESLKVIVEP